MTFFNKQERDELIEDISRSLQSNKPKKKDKDKPENRDDFKLAGEIPLDEVLPPSAGHEVGMRVPNTSSNNQLYKGGLYIESLEERLYRLLENIDASNDTRSSTSANRSVDAQKDKRPGQEQVGTTEVLGHSKGTSGASTPAKAQQIENSSFASRGKVEKTEEDDDEEKSPEGMLNKALDDLGMSDETQIASSS